MTEEMPDARRLLEAGSADPRPLYVRLREYLRWQILSGQVKDQIDGEIELATRLEASRGTVKQAIQALVEEGLLHRRRGRGTFVNQERVEQYFLEISSFTGTMKAHGYSPQATLLALETICPDPLIAGRLGLAEGAETYLYKRVVSLEGTPVVLTISWLPAARFPGFEIGEPSGSLYAVLRSRFGSTPIRTNDVYEAVQADSEVAAALRIAVGAPLLQVTRVAYDQTGDAIEYAVSRFALGKLTVDISPLSDFLNQQFRSVQSGLWHQQVGHDYTASTARKA